MRPWVGRIYRWLMFGGLCLCGWSVSFGFQAGGTAVDHFGRATQLTRQGKLDDAAREYRLGLAIDPSSAAAFNNLGAIYFQQHQYPKAADAFAHAHRLQPDDPAISFNLGLALFSTRNPQAAIAPLTAGTRDPAHSVDAHFLLGACYQDLQQWQRSIAELELAHKARPTDSKILFMLFKSYRSAGDPDHALEAAAELLKANPESPFLHEILGAAYDLESLPTEAEREFKRAIAASPNAPQLHFMLGYVYWRWRRYREAIDPLQAETRISPNFAPPYHYLGDIALRQGLNEQAVDYFKKTLRLDPGFSEAYLGMGRAYFQLGRFEESLKFLREAVKRQPDKVEPHQWLGRALVRAGKPQEGQKELEKAHQINLARDRQVREKSEKVMNSLRPDELSPPR